MDAVHRLLADPHVAISMATREAIPLLQRHIKVKNRVLTAEEGQHQERLAVRTQDGMVLKCEGVSIADHSDEVGEDGIEVAVLGISHPSYSTLFPDRE